MSNSITQILTSGKVTVTHHSRRTPTQHKLPNWMRHVGTLLEDNQIQEVITYLTDQNLITEVLTDGMIHQLIKFKQTKRRS